MPGLSGVDLINRIQHDHPELPVMVLSMHAEAQIVARVLRAGAAGYVTKDCEPGTLVAAVRRVAEGALHRSFAGRFRGLPGRSPRNPSPHDQLSPRERRCSSALPPARRWARSPTSCTSAPRR
jgi:DNA-binding NarL/FixJ family response regulator